MLKHSKGQIWIQILLTNSAQSIAQKNVHPVSPSIKIPTNQADTHESIKI